MTNFFKIFGITLIILGLVLLIKFGTNALTPTIVLFITGVVIFKSNASLSRIPENRRQLIKPLLVCAAILATAPLLYYVADIFDWKENSIALIVLIPFWGLAVLGLIIYLVKLVASAFK